MSEGKEKPKKDSETFHETEYYSKFHEQEASIPEKATSSDPTGEIDEETIQELMDASLSGRDPGEPEDLDIEIKSDWVEGPPQPKQAPKPASRSEVVGTKPSPATTEKAVRRPPVGVVGKRKKPRRRKRWWRYRGKVLSTLKFFFFASLVAGVAGSLWYVEVTGRNAYAELQSEAGEKHSKGDYSGAIECYRRMLNLVPNQDWYRRTRLAFLTGAAYEELWKQDEENDPYFENAIEHYDEATRLDRGEMRVYAVESMLARSEMIIEKGRNRTPPDASRLTEGKRILEELVTDPVYGSNPTVHKGVPHRRLADLIREENPMRAIELLEKARSNQGDLEEGYENLEIGLIYRDLLEDPDQAVEYFERVNQNELAPPEVKGLVEEFLKELQTTPIEDQDLYPDNVLDFFTEKEVEP